jgi:hypothetical protein
MAANMRKIPVKVAIPMLFFISKSPVFSLVNLSVTLRIHPPELFSIRPDALKIFAKIIVYHFLFRMIIVKKC